MREDVVIKPADKGGAVVVWDKKLYVQEGEKQLSRTEHYRKLPHDKTQLNATQVRDTISDEIAKGNLPQTAEHLIENNPRCSRYYMLPNLHKVGCPGRPIISTCNCPTQYVCIQICR